MKKKKSGLLIAVGLIFIYAVLKLPMEKTLGCIQTFRWSFSFIGAWLLFAGLFSLGEEHLKKHT